MPEPFSNALPAPSPVRRHADRDPPRRTRAGRSLARQRRPAARGTAQTRVLLPGQPRVPSSRSSSATLTRWRQRAGASTSWVSSSSASRSRSCPRAGQAARPGERRPRGRAPRRRARGVRPALTRRPPGGGSVGPEKARRDEPAQRPSPSAMSDPAFGVEVDPDEGGGGMRTRPPPIRRATASEHVGSCPTTRGPSS